MKTLQIFKSEGFTCEIEYDGVVVKYTADADIDADGANGQNGAKPAYMVNDEGSEFLANGGMGMRNQRVEGIQPWFKDIVILEGDKPKEFSGSIIASKTAYKWTDKDEGDPAAYVDSETVAYICVPPVVIKAVPGVVKGCKVFCKNLENNQSAWGMVADVGPRNKVGEVSIEMARRLGLNPSPRTGGTEKPIIEYWVYPGIPAMVDGKQVSLMRSNGKYV